MDESIDKDAMVDGVALETTGGADMENGHVQNVDLEGGDKYEVMDTDFDPFAVDGYDDNGSSMVHQPVKLEWSNLSYTAKMGGGGLPCMKGKESSEKKILQEISGEVYPGQMLAIMGSSGAGKTTLLNLLAGRLTTSKNVKTGGQVLVNGEKRDFSTFKRMAAYVEQDDNMFAEVTVSEQIRFSANLRLPKTYNADQRRAKADSIIAELGLSTVKDSFIGSSLVRGVSGGERKRANIGTELVTDPSLIFLDEPTSGLDSFNAINVMHTLQQLARRGRTIVTTIHQPRSNIFSMFDRLLLLSKGRVMYFGHAQEAVAYFSLLNYRCPSNFNPADFFIDLISVDNRTDEKSAKSNARIELLEDAYKKHETVEGRPEASNEYDCAALTTEKQSKYASSWLRELSYVMKRQFRAVLRAKEINQAAIGSNLIFAVLLGLIWLNIGREFFDDPVLPENNDRFQALLGVVFFISINQAFGSTFSVIFGFPLERPVVLRERASGTYRVSSYFISKFFVELPRTMLVGFGFCVITYFMIGLRQTAAAFFAFYFTVLLIAMNAEALTIAIATCAKDAQVTASIVPIFMILALLFAGFFIDDALIPDFLAWIQYISFLKYGLTAILLTQFKGLDDPYNYVLERFANVSLEVCYIALAASIIILRLAAYTFLRINGPKFDRSL